VHFYELGGTGKLFANNQRYRNAVPLSPMGTLTTGRPTGGRRLSVRVRVCRSDWVQIVEPVSRHFVYINIETGECLWDPPKDVRLYG